MPQTREEESRLTLKTLLIASAASLVAALVTAQFWVAGTPIAAALTPVIVAIVSELLHRPTEVIARRVTGERTAVLPPTSHVPREPSSEVRVYRPERRRLGRVHPKLVFLTALLAFALAAAALTLPELLAGQSVGESDRTTTLFGGREEDAAPDDDAAEPASPDEEPPAPEEEQPPPATVPEDAPPEEEPPDTPEEPPLTVPTVPEEPVSPPQ